MGGPPLVVASVCTRYPVVSETFVRLEVAELRRQGVDVLVVGLLPGDPGGAPDLLVSARRPRARVARAHARELLRSPRRYRRFLAAVRAAGPERGELHERALPELAGQLRRAGVRVLHAHFAWSAAAAAHALSELTGLPWVLTVHANDMYGAPVRLRDKLASADEVVTVCRYNAERLRDDWGHDRPVPVVVCGVEVPDPLPAAEPDVDVVAVGRLVPKKGFDVLLRATAQVPGATVRLVGDGPERARLEALVHELDLTGRVEMVGALPHDQVLETVRRGRLLALPARVAADGDRDSMPLVVKEAMARAVPVVVTRVAGLPEAVDDSCGWVVPPEDADALAAALRDVLTRPEEAARRGAAGRVRVQERFRLADQVGVLRAVLTGVVA